MIMNLTDKQKDDLIELLLKAVGGSSLACSSPVEYDYHEWCACEKCFNCETRKRLATEFGLKQFWS